MVLSHIRLEYRPRNPSAPSFVWFRYCCFHATRDQFASFFVVYLECRERVCTDGGRGAASAAATAATGGDTANKPQRKKLILKKLTHDAATSRPSVPSPSATAATGATAAGAAGGEEEVSQGGADPGATQSGGATTGGAAGEPSEAAAPPSNLDSQSPEEQGGATMTTDAGLCLPQSVLFATRGLFTRGWCRSAPMQVDSVIIQFVFLQAVCTSTTDLTLIESERFLCPLLHLPIVELCA